MQKCPTCGHPNRVGVLICEKCGTNLITGRVPQDVDTRSLGEPDQKSLEETDPTLPSRIVDPGPDRNIDEFPHGGTLWLEVEGSAKSVQLPLTTHNREIVLGRRDPATGALPDVDLTPFAGYRMGVSRRHCVLRYGEGKYLDLFDQGSSNGTYLNGTRVEPHQPNRLHDGDRLRLGQITLRLHFEARSVPSAPSAAPLSGLPVAIQQPSKTGGSTNQINVQKSLQNAVAKLTSERSGKPAEGGATEATINLNAEESKALLDEAKTEAAPDQPAPSSAPDTKDELPGTTTEQKVPRLSATEISSETSSAQEGSAKKDSAESDKTAPPKSAASAATAAEPMEAKPEKPAETTSDEDSATEKPPTSAKPAPSTSPDAPTEPTAAVSLDQPASSESTEAAEDKPASESTETSDKSNKPS